MSNFFSGLGAALKAMYGKVTGAVAPNHAAIAAAVDNVYNSATNTSSAGEDYVYALEDMDEATLTRRYIKGDLAKALMTVGTINRVRGLMHTYALLVQAVRLIAADADRLDRNFNKIFGDLKTVDDVKVSHAYVFGYLTLAQKTIDFLAYSIYLTDPDGGDEYRHRPPPGYMSQHLLNNATLVGDFVKMLTEVRGRGRRTIVDDLNSIASGAKNVFVFADGKTIDEYANPIDYLPQVSQMLTQGFSLNPAMWVVNHLLVHSRTKYERNVKMREWLVTRVSLLEMEIAGKTDTAEYQKQRSVLDAYTTMITALDKKIAEYENDV